ncbi:MFS transporter [Pseudogracilibacillus sp. SO30301A]|uniref:MFS transporter n=1 Tax=Pseudogracilibacillus sp. SO30301A TaxID=3098291 RepID=UPI00300E1A7B
MVSARVRYWILIAIVGISGFSQGMLLPLIAIILEQAGVSSSVNGLHAIALYIGILIASPFMEKPMQKLGFKPIILIGGLLVFISLTLFPLWKALWFWFILRMMVGIGDQMIHFGTQTWITTTVSAEVRGRRIAFYGISFALGFSIGPLMTRLLAINEALPFLLSAFFSFLVWALMFFVKNEWPDQKGATIQSVSSLGRFVKTLKISWAAMLTGFGYGFLESTLNGVFPIYGLRIGHDVDMLSLIIPCFAFGSIILQFPLGALSDRFGRRNVLLFSILIGALSILGAALLEDSVLSLFIFFTLSGMFVGSLYSLGMSYMTDLLPISLLPAGNIMFGICFSIGSISGPFLGGIFVQLFPNVSFFYLILSVLVGVFGVVYLKKDVALQEG